MNKQKNKKEEPWSKRFGEDENFSTRQYSRSARHANSDEVAPLYKVLLFFFLALLIIPFGTIYWSRHTRNTPEPLTPDQVMVNKQITSSIAGAEAEVDTAEDTVRRSGEDVKAEQPESVATEEEKPEETPAAESEEAVSTAEPEEAEAEQPTATEEEPESEEDPADESYTNTYTIKAGDNLYRIALNHGMTLDELKAANGLNSDVAEIGTVLKVK